MADENCTILDYETLGEAAIHGVAELFGLQLPEPGSDTLRRILTSDAKDVERKRPFEQDGERKRNAATPLMRQMAESWAEPHYRALRRRAVRF
jgi:hypothetical protein